MNVFNDKRISWSDAQYLAKSQVAVCHWNENVDRKYSSLWHPKHDPKAPRRKKGKKVLKPCTHTYRTNIWKRYITGVYKRRSQ